jgi:hypothetical protein
MVRIFGKKNGKEARGKVVWRGVYYPLSNFGAGQLASSD